MSNEPNPLENVETERIGLIKRKCDSCGAVAVPLEGIGTACETCSGGEYVERVGVQVAEVAEEAAEQYREHYSEAVAE